VLPVLQIDGCVYQFTPASRTSPTYVQQGPFARRTLLRFIANTDLAATVSGCGRRWRA